MLCTAPLRQRKKAARGQNFCSTAAGEMYYNREKYFGAAFRARSRTMKEGQRYEDRFYRHRQHGRRARERLGVKPQMMAGMLAGIAPVLKARAEKPVLISMAAGLTIETIQTMAGGNYPVIRIMPNMPAAVGEGVIFYACSENCEKADVEAFLSYMAPAGRLFALEEKLHDAGSAVAGCGPAFAAMFLEALADGGVACGLPRAAAIQYAAQMMLGTAKMVLETGEHPDVLKDRVCSPGGTTIQGVRALETAGLRGAVFNAVIAAYEKNADLKKAND